MRLQLKWCFVLLLPYLSHGQTDSTKSKKLTKAEINFVYGYYDQDGDLAAVTGGTGTEELTADVRRIILYIPTKKSNGLTIDAGMTTYSSASTDNIDFVVSSASSSERHVSVNLSYHWLSKNKKSYTVKGNFDIESDYISRGFGLSSEITLSKNKKFSWSFYSYFDDLRWGWLAPKWKGKFLIYPHELRDTTWHTQTARYSQLADFSYTSRISNRLRIKLSQGIYHQSGLLSTPFHRVYFIEEERARVENLPDRRWKSSSSLGINYFVNDWLIIRSFQRFYMDTYGVRSYTSEFEFPIKASLSFTFYPIVRFHTQTAARFWKPFKEHESDAEYYASDYDLSSFEAYTLGGGFRIAPPFGFFNDSKKLDKAVIKSMGVRVSHYDRSDGLAAWMGSFRLSFGKL